MIHPFLLIDLFCISSLMKREAGGLVFFFCPQRSKSSHAFFFAPHALACDAIKSVKPSGDILEGLSNGFNMDVSAPDLVHKWFH